MVKFAITLAIIELMTQAVASFGNPSSLYCHVLSSSSGYLISCIANSIDMALGLGPPFLIPLMLFGGLFLNNGSTPVYFIWAKYLSWFYYTWETCIALTWSFITCWFFQKRVARDQPVGRDWGRVHCLSLRPWPRVSCDWGPDSFQSELWQGT